MKTSVHPTAVVSPQAEIGDGTQVGAYACIESGVRLGRDVRVSPYAHLKGDTWVGDNTFIATGAVIGETPQMVGHASCKGKIRIGKGCVIREYATVHSSSREDSATILEDQVFLMALSHVAHDCRLGRQVIVCNGALLAGHVEAQDNCFISGNAVIHQFVRLGRLSFVAGLARVNQDVPPFMMVMGDSQVWGLNLVGLKRAQFQSAEINALKNAHLVLYRQGLSMKKAVEKIRETDHEKVQEVARFIEASKRGICGAKRDNFWRRVFLDYPYFFRTQVETYRIFRQLNNAPRSG